MLTRTEILHLENLMTEQIDTVDRYYLGCLLFALYARCRWSDLASVESLEFDFMFRKGRITGFAEARTREHKTGGHEEKRAMYMPLVAPAVGLSKGSWAQEWQRSIHERTEHRLRCQALWRNLQGFRLERQVQLATPGKQRGIGTFGNFP